MRAPLTAAHAASLCTTAGITAIITGVLAASLAKRKFMYAEKASGCANSP